MCAGAGQNPRLQVYYGITPQLQPLGLWAVTYYAATTIQFVTAAGQAPLVSRNRYPLHLDTHAFVSAIPQRWVANLQGFLPRLAGPVQFGTIGGRGAGQMAVGVRILFTDDPCRDYSVDFLVTPGLDRFNYGLLSLRDLVRHFEIKTVGSHQLGPGGVPTSLPALELIPR